MKIHRINVLYKKRPKKLLPCLLTRKINELAQTLNCQYIVLSVQTDTR